VDKKEIKEFKKRIKRLNQKEILLHLRQISDELSNTDHECKSQLTIVTELLLLTQRLEELFND
jgi:hypothetical protein